MSVLQTRSGFPRVFKADITTSGIVYHPKMQISYLQVYAVTNPLKVYFTEEDFDNDENYVSVPVAAAATPWGWEGPVELGYDGATPALWLKGDGGTSSVTIVFYQRRG